MAFAIMYGLVCGCFLSLSPAVAAQLYGSGRLAGLSGLMLLFNLPGVFYPLSRSSSFCLNVISVTLLGNSAGAPLGGAIRSATGGSWLAVSMYAGGLQILGATALLYGVSSSLRARTPDVIPDRFVF